MNIITLLLLAPLLFLQTNCKEEPTPPPIETPQDTTSHNFVVTRIDTLGDLFSSARAVDIVDENNIWVGGEFTERDTANYFTTKYNLAHWDGTRWNMIGKKIQGYGGKNDTTIVPLTGIVVFNDNNIFVLGGDAFARWDGKKWYTDTIGIAVDKFWARSSDEIYLVGPRGRAAFYNGQTFTKMYTGITNPPLNDIWGDETQLYAVGNTTDVSRYGDENLFLYSDNSSSWSIVNRYKWNEEDNTPPPNIYLSRMQSIYRANKNSKLFLLANGRVYHVKSLSPFQVSELYRLPYNFYSYLIRGNADNDVFVFSQIDGEFHHFNGKTWKSIILTQNFLTWAATVKNNIVTIVGETRGDVVSKGIVILLKRN